MTRLQADLCLGLTAIIWGSAFIAQKTVMAHIGPFTFSGLRFALSALCVLPLALREQKIAPVLANKPNWLKLAGLCLGIIGGVLLQQYAMVTASVTNGGMLTGLYVVLVPIALTLVFRRRQSPVIWAAASLSVIGMWLLTTTGESGFAMPQLGDLLLIASATSFAFQVILMGMILETMQRPMKLCLLQYGAVAIVAGLLALLFERQTIEVLWPALQVALPAIIYAGVISGGIAYTLQAIAQQHTPASDAAIIMGGEGLVAALCGIILLNEPITARIGLGCLAIIIAILVVEVGPNLRWLIMGRNTN